MLKNTDPSLALRALSRLLTYPGPELREALPAIADALSADDSLRKPRREALARLARALGARDPFEVEARYVDTFDRSRRASLYLFEHVHGDSRDRGPAMIDLLQTYEAAGLHLPEGELPDYLPVALEFASTQPPKVARAFLGEIAHILNAIHASLAKQRSPYAAAIAAAIELAGERVRAVEVPADEALDDAWAEPPAFDGCSTRGQARPDQPQPIHFVKPAARQATSQPGVQA
jgi:nitrate reductase delta subunit